MGLRWMHHETAPKGFNRVGAGTPQVTDGDRHPEASDQSKPAFLPVSCSLDVAILEAKPPKHHFAADGATTLEHRPRYYAPAALQSSSDGGAGSGGGGGTGPARISASLATPAMQMVEDCISIYVPKVFQDDGSLQDAANSDQTTAAASHVSQMSENFVSSLIACCLVDQDFFVDSAGVKDLLAAAMA